MFWITSPLLQWTDGGGVVVTPPVITSSDVGHGRPRRKFSVKIDGEVFEIDSRPEDVSRLVAMLKESAAEAAEQQAVVEVAKPVKVRKQPVVPKIELVRPAAPDYTPFYQQLQAQLDAAQEAIRQTYLEAYARVALQQQDDDDIEAILLG